MSRISFCNIIRRAWDLTHARLFEPFDIATWFTIGFAAWLATLGQRSGSFGFSIPADNSQLTNASLNPEQIIHDISTFIVAHFLAITLIGSFLFVIILLLTILILWFSSKGKFLFLYNLTNHTPEIQKPWNITRAVARSLFRWRLVYTILNMVISIMFVVAGILLAVPCFMAGYLLTGPAIGLFILVMVLLLYALIIAAINMAIDDFIVPIMFKKRIPASEAWKIFFRLMYEYIWLITAYGIIKSLLVAGIGIAFFTAYMMTCCFCCCGAILLSIPYISVVVLLPYYVFIKHFNLCFLAQLTDDLNVYAAHEPPPLPIND